MDAGHPGLQLRGEANVGVVHAQGRGHFLLQEAVEGAAINTAHQLANDPAEVAGVVGHDLAWGVLGDDVLHGLHHEVPVPPLVPGQRPGGFGEAGLMGEDVADGDAFLAVLGEFGPVGSHRVVPPETAPLPEDMETDGGQGLGGRVEDEHGAAFHRLARFAVRQPTVEVEDQPAVTVHRQRRAGVESPGQLLVEKPFDFLQRLGVHANAVGGCHHRLCFLFQERRQLVQEPLHVAESGLDFRARRPVLVEIHVQM